MSEKYESLHEHILAVMHDLIYGSFGLSGDAQERTLRAWYVDYQRGVENTVAECVSPPPVITDAPRSGRGRPKAQERTG